MDENGKIRIDNSEVESTEGEKRSGFRQD